MTRYQFIYKGVFMKKKIAIIGANEFQNPLILKAKELGYETHVFSSPFGKVGERTADFFYPISIFDNEGILDKCKEIGPDAITTIASDAAVPSLVHVAASLGLPANEEKDILKYTNKFEMRKALKEAGIKVPTFYRARSIDDLEKFDFPLIVKPTDRAGSMSIHKVDNKNDLEKAILESVDASFEGCAIVEGVILGDEYSCETISYKGKHRILAVTKKYTTGFPHCIETGHIEPSGLNETALQNLEDIVPRVLDALGIKNSPAHIEFKVDRDDEINIIEVGGRMGGDSIGSHLVPLSTGYDFLKMTLDVALGIEPDFVKTRHHKYALVKFIFDSKDIDIMNRIIEKYPDIVVEQSDIEDMDGDIVDNASRYGYYILAFDDEEIKNYLFEDLKIF